MIRMLSHCCGIIGRIIDCCGFIGRVVDCCGFIGRIVDCCGIMPALLSVEWCASEATLKILGVAKNCMNPKRPPVKKLSK